MKRFVCIAVLLVAGCKEERASVVATDVPAAATPAPVAAPAPKMPRLIVRNAEVRAVVSDVPAVIKTLTTVAETAGGYVGDSKTWRDGGQLRSTITLRVPAAHLTETIAALRKAAIRIESETVSSDDVSQEYVDLASQLRNAEAAETELRALMKDVRVKTKRAADVLEMYQQLSNVQGEIERTKGRMQYLSQTAAMSTLKAELIPDAVAKPVVQPGWQAMAVVKDATRALVATLEVLATAAIWIVLYVLPLALLLGAPAARRLFRRRPGGATQPTASL